MPATFAELEADRNRYHKVLVSPDTSQQNLGILVKTHDGNLQQPAAVSGHAGYRQHTLQRVVS